MAYKKTNPNGQATMENSEPVVLASDHSDIKITLDGETITGTVTANAGTNLNTSALALESGGNLASIKTNTDTIASDTTSIQTAVELIDDTVYTDGSGTPSKGLAVMGTDGTNPQILSTNASGHLNIADGGNSITVDGTVAVSGTVTVDGSASTQPISASSLPLPTGASTLSEQQTQTTHLATIAGDTTNIENSVQLIDDTVATTASPIPSKGLVVSGTDGTNARVLKTDTSGELQVDVLTLPNVTIGSALPAGTNGIGKLTANSGVDIGDVDVTSVVPGTTATSLGKAEDAPHSTGDTGVMALAVRKDTAAASSGTTGDYEPLSTDATGRLWIVGAGVEDAAETAGGTLIMSGSVRRDIAASSAGTTGDNATINTDAVGKLWVTGTVLEDVAHSDGEQLVPSGVRRIDTPATSAGTSGDWATMDASAEGAIWATLTPTTTGGCTIFRSIDLDESEEEIKATAGNIYGYYFANTNAAARYLKFYNATAANVTVGTTTPVLTFYLPAKSAGHVAFPFPIGFGTAITAAATTGVADNDTGAPGANEVILNVFYK